MSDRWVVGSKEDLTATPMAGDGIEGVVKRVLVSPEQGWDGWVMRLFDVAPGRAHAAAQPRLAAHQLRGLRERRAASGRRGAPAGAGVLRGTCPRNHEHQFRAAADAPLSFVCIVPESGELSRRGPAAGRPSGGRGL